MDKVAFVAAFAFMTLSNVANASENANNYSFDLQSKHCDSHQDCKKHRHCHHKKRGPRGHRGPQGVVGPMGPMGPAGSSVSGPFGSYYADFVSQSSTLQAIVLPSNGSNPFSAPVHFSGTNANGGVSLAGSGDSIVVPTAGLYTIDWNISVSIQGLSSYDFYSLHLQKNGTDLTPSPQAQCAISILGSTNVDFIHGIPNIASAGSVIVPLSANDEISLLLTIDGSEGNLQGDGVLVQSAQISAVYTGNLP